MDMSEIPVLASTGDNPGARRVLPVRHEVMWRDGSSLQMHPVMVCGVVQPGLRAVLDPATGAALLVDLCRVVPQLRLELAQAAERDRVGLVFYSLRCTFKTAAECLQRVAQAAEGRWVHRDGQLQWTPLEAAC